MRSATSPQSSYLNHTPLGNRVAASCVSILLSGLIIFMLFKLGELPPRVLKAVSKLLTVELLPDPGTSPKRTDEVARQKKAKPPVPQPLPPPPIQPLKMLIISSEEFAASDISKLPRHAAAASGETGTGGDSGTAEGPGEGPGGEKLYNAEWYRKPSHAELATYLPSGGREAAWGMVACRTVERYHVEDCHELAESPVGSGLARALRLAAWQFLVRPPRIGGRPLVGAWVRIRFDFTHEAEK